MRACLVNQGKSDLHPSARQLRKDYVQKFLIEDCLHLKHLSTINLEMLPY